MEMAFRMQFSVPEVFEVSRESQATRDLYGESEFAKGCLIARRLGEQGVRMVQLSHSIARSHLLLSCLDWGRDDLRCVGPKKSSELDLG